MCVCVCVSVTSPWCRKIWSSSSSRWVPRWVNQPGISFIALLTSEGRLKEGMLLDGRLLGTPPLEPNLPREEEGGEVGVRRREEDGTGSGGEGEAGWGGVCGVGLGEVENCSSRTHLSTFRLIRRHRPGEEGIA